MSEKKFCPSCGTENSESSAFCRSCGTSLSGSENSSPDNGNIYSTNSRTPSTNTGFAAQSFESIGESVLSFFKGSASQDFGSVRKSDDPNNPFKPYLMDSREKIVAILGNSYLQNYLTSGALSKGFSVVSDKRVYFRGTVFYSGQDGKLKKRKVSSAVDVNDVTGVSLTYISPIGFIGTAIILVLAAVISLAFASTISLALFFAAAVSALTYFFRRKTLLRIEYAGGEIGFEIKWYSDDESMIYQRALFLTKDKTLRVKQ